MAVDAGVSIAADVGGTFTDMVATRGTEVIAAFKLASSPPEYADAIIEGVRRILGESGLLARDVSVVLHGTTIATNTILERRGARTALLTTRGFRDVLELRRLRRPTLFDLNWEKPPPLVPRQLRLEVNERIDADGTVVEPLDAFDAESTLRRLDALGVESVAICLVNSYANDVHERELVRLAKSVLKSNYTSTSCEISPEIREFERTSTTVVNAYIQPAVSSYITDLRERLDAMELDAALHIMKSNGGLANLELAVRLPASVVESGPAAGATAAAALARLLNLENAIAFDMGGTTAKATLIDHGMPLESPEYEVGAGVNGAQSLAGGGGYALRLPSLDVAEVGAGGGSILWVDALGSPHVGPESSGAVPGPMCYGRGGSRVTVTDANLVLGYLSPDGLAAGTQEMHPDLAREGLATQFAAPLHFGVYEAAYGAHLLANSEMSRAIRSVTTERGRDPRDCTLIAFGGAGPVHAVAIALEFGIRKVVIPPAAGVFSAVGLLHAPITFDEVATTGLTIDDQRTTCAELSNALQSLEGRLAGRAEADGYSRGELSLDRFADMHYLGQSFELRVEMPPPPIGPNALHAMRRDFDATHARLYGRSAPDEQVEIVNIRLRASCSLPTRMDLAHTVWQGNGAPQTTRLAYFGSQAGLIETPVICRADLPETGLSGPAIIEDPDSTIVVPPGARAARDFGGTVGIDVGPQP